MFLSLLKLLLLFSHSVVSDSLWPQRLQHARPPCPSPSPRVCSNSCPLSQWCYPTSPIASSVVPFSFCLQSFLASGFFPMTQLFASGGQSTGVSASDSVRFSRSVMSDSLRPLGLHYARLPCPSPTSRTYSNSSPSNRWCHITISSYVIPFSSCLQYFPASGAFQWVNTLHQVTEVLKFQC